MHQLLSYSKQFVMHLPLLTVIGTAFKLLAYSNPLPINSDLVGLRAVVGVGPQHDDVGRTGVVAVVQSGCAAAAAVGHLPPRQVSCELLGTAVDAFELMIALHLRHCFEFENEHCCLEDVHA